MSALRAPEDEPLRRIIARRALHWARREAATPEFGRLLLWQALGAAGDVLIALALAGSLFFSVPEATARDRVALYLAVTVAPFSVVAPLLSAFLDRRSGAMKAAIIVSSLGRALLAWLLATRLESYLLFPIAFGVLILSRSALVAKSALLPLMAPEGRPLVAANSSLSKVTALAGIAAGGVGLLLVRTIGPQRELLLAAGVYFAGAIPALWLPTRRERQASRDEAPSRTTPLPVTVRQAVVATAAMRCLVGFLVFHLGFALRREALGSVGLGALVGSAALGSLLGAVGAPRLRRWMPEEGIIAASLATAGLCGVIVGARFSVTTAAAGVGVFSLAYGASKVAFDSVVQRDVPPSRRGRAFARLESLLQITWVVGALIPVGIAIPSGWGVMGAGITGAAFAALYMAGQRRAAGPR